MVQWSEPVKSEGVVVVYGGGGAKDTLGEVVVVVVRGRELREYWRGEEEGRKKKRIR